MLTLSAEYALRAVVFLAQEPHVPRTAEAIAVGSHIPLGYLGKIMARLARAGLVHAQRGRRGGFSLTRPPHAISMRDVMQATDPPGRALICPDHRDIPCPLYRRLQNVAQAEDRIYGETSIGQLVLQERAIGRDGVR